MDFSVECLTFAFDNGIRSPPPKSYKFEPKVKIDVYKKIISSIRFGLSNQGRCVTMQIYD